MVKFTLRVDDDGLIGRFDELAKTNGKTRTAYIIELMQHAVDTDYVPAREGEGFRAKTETGGEATLIRHSRYVSGGMTGLDPVQKSAYEQARELASPNMAANGRKPAKYWNRRALLFIRYMLSPVNRSDMSVNNIQNHKS